MRFSFVVVRVHYSFLTKICEKKEFDTSFVLSKLLSSSIFCKQALWYGTLVLNSFTVVKKYLILLELLRTDKIIT